MTVPVAAAMQLAKSFKGAMIYSIIFGEIAVTIGLISAFYLDIAPVEQLLLHRLLLLLTCSCLEENTWRTGQLLL